MNKNDIFCLVIDGTINKYNVRQKDTGLGVNSSIEIYNAKGYYLVVGTQPAIDTATQRIGQVTYTFTGTQVVKTYEVVDITIEEQMAKVKVSVEQAIEQHINDQCKELGYDNENSISKYLVVGNDFYDECSKLSLWIGSVWTKSHSIEAEVAAGTIPMPTIKEVIAELPAYVS